MIINKKVYKPFISYSCKVIPLAFDESISYYECICNIANHINDKIIPAVNESLDLVTEDNKMVIELNNDFIELKEYVNDHIVTKTSELINDSGYITKNVNDLTNYTKSSDLSSVATSGDYDDLSNKPTIPDVSNFITKDVNDLTYYTLSSNLSSVATSGNYNDLSNTPTIPTVPTNISSFNNDSGYITKDVNDLTYYTTTTSLTSLLNAKENSIDSGSNTYGYWIKLDSGIMIQYGSMTLSSYSVTNAYGSLYYNLTSAITLPQTFTTIITTNATLVTNGVGGVCINNITTSSISFKVFNGSSLASLNGSISWIAIGTWK